ncbi:HNH endonuclease [Devosia sp. Naph2]|uniref:HNH endonuclease n=1 Tax=Devosia polycyclovorans TaxID=3345148 RepID=UPI0035CFDEC1
MPVAVINVRPSRQRSLNRIRIDNRNKEIALACIGEKVLLYAPRDEVRHGYFASALLVDVVPDRTRRRFMFLTLENVTTFCAFYRLEDLATPIESQGYRGDGSIEFSHFSPSIRALNPLDRQAALALVADAQVHSAAARSPATGDAVAPAPALRPSYRTREAAIRKARLRWAVLYAYGTACAICGDDNSIHEIGAHEVEVCHLRALAHGGPDELTNAMPMCRTDHWFYDRGIFTMMDGGGILLSRLAPGSLHRRLADRSVAQFPVSRQAWPKAEHLRFHREHVFLG